jgi:aryl-alcohol dehydrogenase-like predicted oxidoreductase
MNRRDFIETLAGAGSAMALGCRSSGTQGATAATHAEAAAAAPAVPAPAAAPAGARTLGRTGIAVDAVSLGGEGILRTHGRAREAVPVILEALRLGVRYCDTAPAYAQSQDYYGAAFREAGRAARDGVFLASKTHDRDRDGSLRLLDDSLRRIGTDRLDLWQLHDLRDDADLDAIFGRGGALEALVAARDRGLVRFLGITGHTDPRVLVEAMRRFAFDTVLCAMNPADGVRASFLREVVPEARRRGVGVIGMKVLGRGRIVADGSATAPELIRYAASFADTCIIGCDSVAELRNNLAVRDGFRAMPEPERAALESRLAARADRYTYYKG